MNRSTHMGFNIKLNTGEKALVVYLFFLQLLLSLRMFNVYFPATTLIIAVMFLCLVCICINAFIKPMDLIGLFLAIYTFLSVVSIINYILPSTNLPVPANLKLYFSDLTLEILPISLFFISKWASRKSGRDNIEGILIIANSLVVIIGMLLFFIRPSFYSNFMFREFIGIDIARPGIGVEEILKSYTRLMSFLGSTSIGVITVISIALLLFRNREMWAREPLLILHTLGCILSMQRSAWICMVFVYIIAFIDNFYVGKLAFKNNKYSRKSFLSAVFWVIAITVAVNTFQLSNYILRLSSIGKGAVNERAQQWVMGVNVFLSNPLGVGLGRMGHQANALYGYGVTDGQYFKVLAEIGIPGLMAVILFFSTIIYKRWQKDKLIAVAAVIVAFQAVGSNNLSLDIYAASVIWIYLGLSGKQMVPNA
jgi:hypothetical protein